MPSWLHHPRYIPLRDQLILRLRSPKYRFRRLQHVAFLCGAANSRPRNTLRDYILKAFATLRPFYAEAVWLEIAKRTELSALEMEAMLADLADVVIIILESPGTFAELGAFTLSDALRPKLLPIVDLKYHDDPSFIMTGPIRWIDQTSLFKPSVVVHHERILECVADLQERLDRLPTNHSTHIEDLAASPRHLLFFICDVVAVIQPATLEMIDYYITRVVPAAGRERISNLVGMAIAMELLGSKSLSVGGLPPTAYYYRNTAAGWEPPFHHHRLPDLPSERAAHVSVMQTITEARAVMDAFRNVDAA